VRSKLAVLVAVLLVLGVYEGVSAATPKPTTTIPAFVGDSNVLLATSALAEQFVLRGDSYPFVIVARVGSGLRFSSCADGAEPCATNEYWRTHLAALRAKVKPDVYVVNLGINDTVAPGTATTPGYFGYAKKIDDFLALLGNRPVLWTNLPCIIEPAERRAGCNVVNAALRAAPARHPNLTLLDWATIANPHPGYMATFLGGVHYTPTGYAAWTKLVASTLESRFGHT
jgi:lysophospholipase L1-like esterase